MKDSDLSTTAARDAARIVWFKRYPAKQTLIAFLLALLATTAFSIDPAPVSSNAVLAIDPKASGMLYVCYEVLLSFAGHTDAVMLLALACLLTLPFRYVFFGRGDAWRPSVILPSLFFAVCMVFGRSYDLTDSAEIVLGDKARIICAWIGGAGWMLLAVVAFYLAFDLAIAHAHITMAGAMETIAAYTIFLICLVWKCIHICMGWHSLMECSVEHSNLWNVRHE